MTAEGRLRAAGFINSVGFWKEPGGERLFDTVDAIAALDAGEYPAVDRTLVIPTPGSAGVAEHARMIEEQMRRQEEEAASPPPPRPGSSLRPR